LIIDFVAVLFKLLKTVVVALFLLLLLLLLLLLSTTPGTLTFPW
jgi:hypothetical protein